MTFIPLIVCVRVKRQTADVNVTFEYGFVYFVYPVRLNLIPLKIDSDLMQFNK